MKIRLKFTKVFTIVFTKVFDGGGGGEESGDPEVVARKSSPCSPGGGRRGSRRGDGEESGTVARIQDSWPSGRTGRRAVTRIWLPTIPTLDNALRVNSDCFSGMSREQRPQSHWIVQTRSVGLRLPWAV